MIKKLNLYIGVLIIISITNFNLIAQANNPPASSDKQTKESTFLITTGLPHLTKVVKQEWDNPSLNLTDDQKTKLLVVREETIAGVKNIGPQITELHKQVTEEIFLGKTPDELSSIIKSISKLKTEATMIHLNCIYNTREILNEQQRKILSTL